MNLSETKTYASEKLHWYKQDGTPAYTTVGKNGKERNTTLRDARVHKYLPSVTTIMKCAASPGLEQWKMNQVLMAALTLPRIEGESEADYVSRIKQDAKEQASKASEMGTIIHGALEGWYASRHYDPKHEAHVSGTIEAIDKHFINQSWCAEKSFADARGYGGKVDLHSVEVVIDFKTKEFTEDKLPEAYDEHIMQLAAYRRGLGVPEARCANVFVSVTVPGLVHIVEHSDDDLVRGLSMFDSLLDYWKFKNNYHP